MMERLRLAHDDFFTASPADKKAALQRYVTALSQFNALLSHGELPQAGASGDGRPKPEPDHPVD